VSGAADHGGGAETSGPGAAGGADATGEPPFIDAHSITVAAPAEQVWEATAQVVRRWPEHTFPRLGASGAAAPMFARLLGCADIDRPPPGPGVPEAVVGFRVARVEQPSLIALEGEHRFSRYALTFKIEPADGSSSIVTAETRAAFRGRAGRGYRTAVIGTGAHVIVVRRLLSSIKRRAEREEGWMP
jgi:hypothetical protein